MDSIFKALILTLPFAWFVGETKGQAGLGFEESLNLSVRSSSDTPLATVGGFSNPQFSPLHLNSDSRIDLLVFDRASGVSRTFIYDATSEEHNYSPQYEAVLPEASDLLITADYNCDGRYDLFTYRSGGMSVYQNLGGNPPQFQLVKGQLETTYFGTKTNLYLLQGDIPAIVDEDGDGDLDILAFGNLDAANTIVLHKNLSMEYYGTCDSLEFEITTTCWGGITEPENSSKFEAISCKPPKNFNSGSARHHPGSTLLLFDRDLDGDLDLAAGDILTDRMVYATNAGVAGSAEIDTATQTTQFPNSSAPVRMPYLVSAFALPNTGGGQPDLLCTVNNRTDSSCNRNHVWYYNHTSGGEYELITKKWLIGKMLDLGSGTVPMLMDYDGDGLKDLLVSSAFARSPGQYRGGRLHLFLNTGTSSAPVFTHTDSTLIKWSQYGFEWPHPTLGDMDGDGDLDMLVGTADGSLHYFKNTGTAGAAQFTLTEPFFQGINSIGAFAAPAILDVNGDDLPDILVGERTGTIHYFQNTGNSSQYEFASQPTIEKFGDIDVDKVCCNGYAAPFVFVGNGFGPGRFLFVGTDNKKVYVYALHPSDANQPLTPADSIVVNAGLVKPLLADVDGDGIIELLVGTGEGGLKFYDRASNVPIGVGELPALATVKVFPNPTSVLINIRHPFGSGAYRLRGLDGRLAASGTLAPISTHIDAGSIQPGFYIIDLIHNGKITTSEGVIVLPR
ncbi:MAG: VCBS repeat-containing protein [Salibacteraceae bacterium]